MVRLSSCKIKQLTSVATEVRILLEKSYTCRESDAVPTPANGSSSYRFVTRKEAAEIIRPYETDITATEVGEETGRPLSTVTDVLRRHSIEIRKQYSRIDANPAEIARLYRAGQSVRKIAEKLGMSKSTVSKLLAGAGIPLRSKSEAALLRSQYEEGRR